MLIYVLWHRNDNTDSMDYESSLIKFHAQLNANETPGFIGSTISRSPTLPWLNDNGNILQDNYFLENSAALDHLNAAAISKACEHSHNQVATNSRDEKNGLYRHRIGLSQPQPVNHSYWISKPKNITHLALLESISNNIDEKTTSVWTRFMGLSFGPDFWIQSQIPLQLDLNIPITYQKTEQLWQALN